jgi:hypothetical protein
VVENLDYDQSSRTQHKFRFTMTNLADIDNAANLPQFFIALPLKQRLFSYTLLHTFSPNLINETRLASRRSTQNFPVPGIPFPGLADFPNITIDELGVNIGPDQNAPQFTIENNYQVIDNVSYQWGNHALKVGGDFRNIISPQTFTQRLRGDYEYGNLETFLRDISPDVFGERNAGNNVYYGNQHILYAFAQDDWRVRSNLTLNMGVNYSFQQVPLGARTSQPLNAISSVPGLIEFREPKAQTKNFAPKVGFAYSPNFKSGMLGSLLGEGGKTSIRGGFSMAYDYIFDNLYILSNPPQLQQTNDVSTTTTGFLAGGGLPNTPVAITSAVSLAGTYTWESGEQVTIRSGTDANLNNDSAGDRAIFNPNGQEGVGTLVDPLVRTDGQIVGYVARNPNARYLQAAAGAVSNLGRNTFSLPPINNLDFSLFKNFRFGETRLFQIRADMFNVLNHPQYVAGSVNAVDPIATTGVTRFNQVSPTNADFLQPSQIFSSNPRVLQFAARFNF